MLAQRHYRTATTYSLNKQTCISRNIFSIGKKSLNWFWSLFQVFTSLIPIIVSSFYVTYSNNHLKWPFKRIFFIIFNRTFFMTYFYKSPLTPRKFLFWRVSANLKGNNSYFVRICANLIWKFLIVRACKAKHVNMRKGQIDCKIYMFFFSFFLEEIFL